MADFRNRIVGYGEEDPKAIQANPLNWRTHSKAQQKALEGVLSDVGVVQNIIVNKRTGTLVDGHLRVSVAIKNGQKTVPITYVDLSPEEEALILTTLDPIGAMAGTDRANLEELMNQFNSTNNSVQELVSGIAEDAHIFDEALADKYTEEKERESVGEGAAAGESVVGLRNDQTIIFSSSNKWGVPDLLPDMLSDQCPEITWGKQDITDPDKTFILYGSNKAPDSARGAVLGFFVEDERFEVVWNSPGEKTAEFTRFGWGALVPPDFSLTSDMPFPHMLWNLYRERWVARYWQEAGLPVIPNIKLVNKTCYELMVETLPKKAPLMITQVRNFGGDKAFMAFWIKYMNMAMEELKPQKLLIYGGTEHRDWLEPNLTAIDNVAYLDSWTAVRSKVRKQKPGG